MPASGKSVGGAVVVLAALLAAVLGLGVIAVIIGSYFFSAAHEAAKNGCTTTTSSTSSNPKIKSASTLGKLTVKGQKTSIEQAKNIQMFAAKANKTKHPIEAFLIMFIGATQESSITSITYGYPGSSSLGVWQQIAAWGPASVRLNADKSTDLFLNALFSNRNWHKVSPGKAVQMVQRSDPAQLRNTNPELAEQKAIEAYEKHLPEARAFAKKIYGSSGASIATVTQASESTVKCDNEKKADRVEQIIQAAMSRQGDDYVWNDSNGSGLVAWAAKQGNITLSTSLSKLMEYDGNKSEGVTATILNQDDIEADGGNIERDNMVFINTDSDPAPEKVGFAVGDPQEVGSFVIATYNARGASHTDRGRSRELHSSVRTKKMVHVLNDPSYPMDVIGLQEFELKQWRQFDQATDDFGIYPPKPVYKRKDGRTSVNSVIWRKSRFELVEGDTRGFHYFGGNYNQIPVVKLRDKTTGGKIIVSSVHDPADVRGNNAKWRNKDAKIHIRYFADVKSQDSSVTAFGPGDYNSKTHEKPHRIMMGSGLVDDAYAMAGSTGKRAKIDRVYVSKGARARVSDYRVISTRDAKLSTDHLPVAVRAAVGSPRPSSSSKGVRVLTHVNGKVGEVSVNPKNIVRVIQLTATDTVPVSAEAKGSWVFPLKKGSYTFNRNSYGPGMSGHSFHNGSDFGTNGGTPKLVAMHSGKVLRKGYAGAWGNHYVIETGVPVKGARTGTYKYLYGHLSEYASGIQPGDTVKAGQYLGDVGSTGNSTGEHLHLNVCTDLICTYGSSVGSKGTVDPIQFLASLGIKP